MVSIFLSYYLTAAAAGTPALPEKLALPGYVRIDDRVATGGQPTSEVMSELHRAGVGTIVSLRTAEEHDLAAEKAEVEGLGMRFVSIPVPGLDFGVAEVEAVRAVAREGDGGPLLIHCASGNRVGALWMIHRVLDDDWKVDPAEAEARKIGAHDAAVAAAKAYLETRGTPADQTKTDQGAATPNEGDR